MKLLSSLLDVIYPRLCLACEQRLLLEESQLCLECSFDLPLTQFSKLADNPVYRLYRSNFEIEGASAYMYFRKQSKVQRLLHELKYRNNEELGLILGRKSGKDVKNWNVPAIDFLTPVPLHPKKEKKRGYNQSMLLVKGISEVTGLPIANEVLVRKSHSRSQTLIGRFDRWKNVQTMFELNCADELENKHVLLVDDVITTGATMLACLEQLKKINGVKVSIYALAFADHL